MRFPLQAKHATRLNGAQPIRGEKLAIIEDRSIANLLLTPKRRRKDQRENGSTARAIPASPQMNEFSLQGRLAACYAYCLSVPHTPQQVLRYQGAIPKPQKSQRERRGRWYLHHSFATIIHASPLIVLILGVPPFSIDDSLTMHALIFVECRGTGQYGLQRPLLLVVVDDFVI